MLNPTAEYQSRLHARRTDHARLLVRDAWFSYARFATFAIGVATGWLAWQGRLSAWWVTAPLVAFIALVVFHDRLVRARDTMSRAVAFYERGLARIADRWAGGGSTGERFRDPEHPCSQDLDLFGPASLFELLSLAATPAGEEALAAWLTMPAARAEVVGRQRAVAELATRLDLREQLSLAGSEIASKLHSDVLGRWAGAPRSLTSPLIRPIAILLGAAMVAAVVIWARTGEPTPFLVVLLLELIFWMRFKGAITGVLHSADEAARELGALATVLERIEEERFESDRIRSLQADLGHQDLRASKAIRRLRWLVELHDWEHNVAFAPVAALLLWSTHVAGALENWRARFGHRVATWLRVSGEFEALSSLSAYHFEHPDDPFPEMVEPADRSAVFDGVGLGHPLIPASRLVRNDVCLNGTTRLLVVSGSNMSGKSTMLRTVGVAATMAMAGAPVRATSLRVTALQIGATLRIQDSLQEGRSRFYAEISRIRALTELASGPVPLLFLLDELFHGTNSHDRVVGASGVLRAFLDKGAIGLITTHDLAVTRVADTLTPLAANVHFDDRFEHGEILFDYRMKPGPVTHGNAVALMRAVGLDVPEQD